MSKNIGNIRLPTPILPNLSRLYCPPVDANLASEFYRRLVKWISNFDKSLDNEYEVGLRLVSFGEAMTFHLTSLSYWNPSLISFKGLTKNGEPVELIQHVTQISLLLMKIKRTDPEKPKRSIGFIQESDNDENA